VFNHLLSKIQNGLQRDRDLPLGERLRKGLRLLAETAAARALLRDCDAVGPGTRVAGRPRIANAGSIEIGGEVVLTSTFSPVELITAPGGRIEIGKGTWINFGATISAARLVRIGERSQIGQYSIVADSDLPGGDDPRPVEIGADVWIAGRVTVLPGARIGDGSVITAGSVVSGEIPAGVVAGGIPARVLRSLKEAPQQAQAPSPRPEPRHRAVLIADFTISELARQLDGDEVPRVASEEAPFGQVAQTLLAESFGDADVAVIWTRPESAIASFARLLAFEPVDERELLAEVDAFCALVKKACGRLRAAFVPTWTLPRWQRGLGLGEGRVGGAARALCAINLRLMEGLSSAPNVHVLNAEPWLQAPGGGYHPKLWYLGKVPFHDAVFAEAARDVKAALRGLSGQARKLVVVDLDDTLWGGIVGDVGWEGLELGGHDADGEAFVDFQRALKDLTRRGVVLAIASKNEESVALEAIRKHPEMVLRDNDFVAFRINWNDKARNISEIAAELNLGLSSVVFIDDNPAERGRVREALPEVLVPDWPLERTLYPSALLSLRCFDSPALTAEDAQRTALYAEERQRSRLQQQVGSIDEWIAGLGLRVRVEPLAGENLTRAAQLLNKTNQMNLSTRRLTEPELRRWAGGAGRSFWTVHVADRFGDAGLTGLLSLEANGKSARIIDFVLSCRVMGRRVEETMLHVAVAHAQRLRLSSVEAHYLPTPKNKPCLSFWQRSGFRAQDERFVWDLEQSYPLPPGPKLETRS